ncbi:MAG: hypothetical protein VX127_09850 [Myxococcota bacterium]|nr:hypothetical protein [Myxococcota bacterium]
MAVFGTLPALASGTSADFPDEQALPQALRGRRFLFIMGPSGVGKTRVARALAGRGTREWSGQQLREAVAAFHRGAPWPDTLSTAPRVILNCPHRLESDPSMQAGILHMFRLREAADGWTAIVQSQQGTPMTDLMAAVAPEHRATIALRFPFGESRLAFAQSLCAEHGLPPERAEATASIEPWSYTAVRRALGLAIDAEASRAPEPE